MDTIRIAEQLAAGGVFTDEQAKRIATTPGDHLAGQLIAERYLEELRTQLTAAFKVKLTNSLSSVRNQLLVAQGASFIGIILCITLWL